MGVDQYGARMANADRTPVQDAISGYLQTLLSNSDDFQTLDKLLYAYTRSDTDKAIELFTMYDSSGKIDSISDTRARSQILCTAAKAYNDKKQVDNSIELFRRSLNREFFGPSLNGLILAYQKIGHPEQAVAIFQAYYEQGDFQTISDRSLQTKILQNTARACHAVEATRRAKLFEGIAGSLRRGETVEWPILERLRSIPVVIPVSINCAN